MRLLARITWQHILISLAIFCLGVLVTYAIFKRQVIRETDFTLRSDVRTTFWLLEKGLPYDKVSRPLMEIRVLPTRSDHEEKAVFSDTLAYHGPTEADEWMRKLTTVKEVGGVWYEVQGTLVIFEQDDVIRTVVVSLLWVFGGLITATVLGNYWLYSHLLRPFQVTLDKIAAFDVTAGHPEPLPRSAVREFDLLNQSLHRLMLRSEREYWALKEFSENASHELQTPLAILRGKLDLLIQSPRLNGEDMLLVEAMYQATERLNRLGQGLVWLTKIENQEFVPSGPLSLGQVLRKHLQGLEELIDLRQIEVVLVDEPAVIHCHPTLADVLVGNLLQNAIRHNVEGGRIEIRLTANQLTLSNTGQKKPLNTTTLFQRFARQGGEGSLGLGLAICYKICEVQNYYLDYQYESGMHRFAVRF